MPIRIETEIPHKAEKVWAVVGTPDRIDWVNGVESCVYSDGIRRFKMDGAGDLAERILLKDDDSFRLEYSVVESTPKLAAHKASIQLIRNERGTTFVWETKVDPAAVEPFIQQGMETSLERLREVLAKEN